MILVGNKSDLEPERTVSRFKKRFQFHSQYQMEMESSSCVEEGRRTYLIGCFC